MDDPDVADDLLDRDDNHGPRLREWSSDHEMLVAIFDRVGDLIGMLSKSTVPRAPRPTTAVTAARARRRAATHRSLVTRVLPEARQEE